MKRLICKAPLIALLASLALWGRTTPTMAAENDPSPGGEPRLQRLEQRINQLAERQEQLMRHLEAAQNPRNLASQGAPQARAEMRRTAANPENVRRPMAMPGAPGAATGNVHKPLRDMLGLLFLAAVFCNILLAVWIFTDIRKRGEGSGLFIAMALVAGIPAAIIYALVRIGDKKPGASA